MTDQSIAAPAPLAEGLLAAVARRAESVAIPLAALLVGCAAFSLFLLALGKSPAQFFDLVWRGGFGSEFSWRNTLSRAAPLLLAALCVALPARLGLTVIGGEGAIALGGLGAGAASIALAGVPGALGLPLMAAVAAALGGAWIGLVGWLRHARGVNETISSLLMAYIAIALFNHLVEGAFRDPASLNKPSTPTLPDALRVGDMPGLGVHWGFGVGVLMCVLAWVLIERTRWGFAARIAGGNVRAAQLQGLPVGALIVGFTALGGACAGLVGFFEVTAVHGAANASILAGYGYAGILIAFLARHNPLVIVPVAILVGGLVASGGLIQRRMDLPDATVLVLQGFVFVAILLSETLYGRFRIFAPERWGRA